MLPSRDKLIWWWWLICSYRTSHAKCFINLHSIFTHYSCSLKSEPIEKKLSHKWIYFARNNVSLATIGATVNMIWCQEPNWSVTTQEPFCSVEMRCAVNIWDNLWLVFRIINHVVFMLCDHIWCIDYDKVVISRNKARLSDYLLQLQ